MPSYKTLAWVAAVCWTVTTGLLIADLVAANLNPSLFGYCLAVAATLTVLASLTYLQMTAVAPVREAFIHGYELATQHAAAVKRAAEPGTDLARILRPPAGAWTVNEQRPPVAVVGEERAASQHRAKPPWRGAR